MAEKTVTRQVKIAGRPFRLQTRDVARALRGVDPEPIKSHYVVVGTERFPPKQVIGAVTGLDRADFTSHQARRTLMRLGFSVGRRGGTTGSQGDDRAKGAAGEPSDDDRWSPYVGQWVAVKDDELLRAADTPQALVGWLTRHGQRADTMFRVPEHDGDANGLAPL